MINVRVHTILHLVGRLGARELTVALPEGSTVVQLLGVVAERMGVELDAETLMGQRNADVRREFVIAINGRSLVALDGVDTALKDGDDIALLPPIAGG